MRGVKRCQESTGRMKKHRYSNEFKVTAVKLASALDIETKAVAEALSIHPFMLARWKKEVREGTLTGLAHPDLKERKAVEVTVAEETRIRELEAALKKAGIENDLLNISRAGIWRNGGQRSDLGVRQTYMRAGVRSEGRGVRRNCIMGGEVR